MTLYPQKQTQVFIARALPFENKARFMQAYSLCRAARKAKIDALHFEKDKCLSLAAEMLLRHACKEYGVDYATENITVDENSKPKFARAPLHFNLSHSGNVAICAMSPWSIGCDVEKIHDIDMALAKRFFCQKEYEQILACEKQEQKQMFFRLWTLKESFMKCTGLGFKLPLSEFCIEFFENKISVTHTLDSFNYHFFEYSALCDYKLAACLRLSPTQPKAPLPQIIFKEIELEI